MYCTVHGKELAATNWGAKCPQFNAADKAYCGNMLDIEKVEIYPAVFKAAHAWLAKQAKAATAPAAPATPSTPPKNGLAGTASDESKKRTHVGSSASATEVGEPVSKAAKHA